MWTRQYQVLKMLPVNIAAIVTDKLLAIFYNIKFRYDQ